MKDQGRYAEIPGGEYPPIAQACVVLKSSNNQEAARQFVEFVKTASIRDVLRSYGFDVDSSGK
jgi:ABC-type molybdate transport system substrate-binding protein